MQRSPLQDARRLTAAAILGIVCLAGTAPGKEPPPQIKRLLYPARDALAVDSLDLAERAGQQALAADADVAVTHLLLGEVALRKGKLGPAQDSYRRALALGGAQAEALAGLALVALAREAPAAAESAAVAALAADKRSWPANYAMGRLLLDQGKLAAAQEYFAKGKSKKSREDGRDLFETGMGLLALADRDAAAAETCFIKARALAPNTISSTMNLAGFYEATGQWGQAATVLQAAEEKFGGGPLLSYRLGRALENQQQWNDALRQYQEAIAADSTFAPAVAAVGHLYLLDRSKTNLAIGMLQRALALQATPRVRLDLGLALTRAGRVAEALPYLEAAVRDSPTSDAKAALARACVAAEKTDEALSLYSDPEIESAASAADLLEMAGALIKAQQYDEARVFLAKTLAKDPGASEVYAKRGFIDLMEKKYESAADNFTQKLTMDPGSASSQLNLGSAYYALNRKPEAFVAFRKATQLAPTAPTVWVQLGQVLMADSTAAAQRAFERALQLDPQSADAQRGLGLTLLIQEQYPQAIAALRSVTAAEPDHADAWLWLGQALLNAGRHAEARTAYERAAALAPGNPDVQSGLRLLDAAGIP